jgi:predicted amidophosphoribosyltransferase
MGPLTALAELLAPHRCPACGGRAAPPWCAGCGRGARALVAADTCPRCGLPGVDARDDHGCWPAGGPVARSVAAYVYGRPVADAIVAGKAGGAWAVWPALGRELGAALSAAEPAAELVVPVPTDPRRRRRRGVDHTAVLATEVGRALELPVAAVLAVAPGRTDQGERPTESRWAVPLTAFRPRRLLPPLRVLLVDDVLTTGGTAWAAAAALRRGGAAEVVLGVVARAGRHPLRGVAAPSGRAHTAEPSPGERPSARP